MAFAFTIDSDTEKRTPDGVVRVIKWSATDVGATSEVYFDKVSDAAVVLYEEATLESGTGTSLQTEWGDTTGWTSGADGSLGKRAAAANPAITTSPLPVTPKGVAGRVYYRPAPDAGTDNVCSGVVRMTR
jgi:hypothetical protein